MSKTGFILIPITNKLLYRVYTVSKDLLLSYKMLIYSYEKDIQFISSTNRFFLLLKFFTPINRVNIIQSHSNRSQCLFAGSASDLFRGEDSLTL